MDQLFASDDPIGETIRVNNERCTVVGVLDVKGQSATGQDQDDQFLMPYTTVMKKIKGQNWLDDIMCSAISAQVADQAEQEIIALMRERHHIRPGADDDFNLRHPTEIAEAVKQSTQTMEGLLAAVASVSLIVGGIGIMNIMLVSVTERTREIGLRQAVGARGRDVLRQFLVEAVILSLIGGAIGIALGTFGARTIAESFEWPTHVVDKSDRARLQLFGGNRRVLRLLPGAPGGAAGSDRGAAIRVALDSHKYIREQTFVALP